MHLSKVIRRGSQNLIDRNQPRELTESSVSEQGRVLKKFGDRLVNCTPDVRQRNWGSFLAKKIVIRGVGLIRQPCRLPAAE